MFWQTEKWEFWKVLPSCDKREKLCWVRQLLFHLVWRALWLSLLVFISLLCLFPCSFFEATCLALRPAATCHQWAGQSQAHGADPGRCPRVDTGVEGAQGPSRQSDTNRQKKKGGKNGKKPLALAIIVGPCVCLVYVECMNLCKSPIKYMLPYSPETKRNIIAQPTLPSFFFFFFSICSCETVVQ